MKKSLILATVAATAMLMAGCTEPQQATKVLEGAGYTNIEITGYDWWGCSEDDWFHTAFNAVGPTGKSVSGVVCSGMLFKNSTIRF